MGFFAVSRRGIPANFAIEACHLTFWVLPTHWYRWRLGFCYFFDVGLRISTDAPLRRFRLALPFDSEGTSIADLSASVLDEEFAPLIFGRPVKIRRGRLNYDGSTVGQGKILDRVIPISPRNCSPEKERDKRFSVWTIELTEPVHPGESAYVRLRISLKDPGALWTSKGWAYAKRGMIVDLRVADVRESNFLGLGKPESRYLVPIKHLFLFLGAPSYFVPKHVSPSLHYSRLLEPKVWGHYLNASSLFSKSPAISIHQWRSEGGGTAKARPVDLDNPYRAYMDISREFGRALWFYYAAFAISLPIVSGIINWAWSTFIENKTLFYLQLFWRWLVAND